MQMTLNAYIEIKDNVIKNCILHIQYFLIINFAVGKGVVKILPVVTTHKRLIQSTVRRKKKCKLVFSRYFDI